MKRANSGDADDASLRCEEMEMSVPVAVAALGEGGQALRSTTEAVETSGKASEQQGEAGVAGKKKAAVAAGH